MAKSEWISRLNSQVSIDSKTESILIRNLLIQDREVYDVLSDQEDSERVQFVKKAVKIGAIALKDVVVKEKIDYVKREFDNLCFHLEKIFKQELGKEGMKGELDEVFGDTGKLQNSLERMFGTDGKLVRDILDMNNVNSPVGQLRKTIESYFVGKDSEIYGMLDPNSKDSPISRLRTEILEKLQDIENTITVYLAKKEVIEKTPKKGFDFEDELEDALVRLSKPFGDLVERTGIIKGKLGNLKGDFVITLHDSIIEGQQPKIVVEAKTNASVRLTVKSLVGELRDAIQNREAILAIAVTDKPLSDSVGCFHQIEGNIIICSIGESQLPLEAAYRIARTHCLMKNRESPTKTIDTNRVCGIIGKISNDLNTLRGIKANLSKIGNTADTINGDLKTLEKNIRYSLGELQDVLNQDAAVSS